MDLSKRKPYRNKKILDSAKGEECTLNSPLCNHDSSTVVFCHLNEHFAGKGGSQKADDCAGFYGCSACHDLYDRRVNPGEKETLYAEQECFYVLRAYYRTIRKLIDKKIIGA